MAAWSSINYHPANPTAYNGEETLVTLWELYPSLPLIHISLYSLLSITHTHIPPVFNFSLFYPCRYQILTPLSFYLILPPSFTLFIPLSVLTFDMLIPHVFSPNFQIDVFKQFSWGSKLKRRCKNCCKRSSIGLSTTLQSFNMFFSAHHWDF